MTDIYVDEYCGICDAGITRQDIKDRKAIFGTIRSATYEEPSECGYICKLCVEREKDFERRANSYQYYCNDCMKYLQLGDIDLHEDEGHLVVKFEDAEKEIEA